MIRASSSPSGWSSIRSYQVSRSTRASRL
jgi:hypothetical protein